MNKKEYQKQWRTLNLEKIREYKKKYYHEVDKNRVKEAIKEKRKTIEFKRNKAKQQANRLKRDPLFKAKRALRKRLWEFKKRHGTISLSKEIGCSWDFLKTHLESKFTEGMSWDNYGVSGWHIDHIKPLGIASNLNELKKLTHYTNLQPLWAKDNTDKSITDSINIKQKSLREGYETNENL